MAGARLYLAVVVCLLSVHLVLSDDDQCSCVNKEVLRTVHPSCEPFFEWIDEIGNGEWKEVKFQHLSKADQSWFEQTNLHDCSEVWEYWSCASSMIPCVNSKGVLGHLQAKVAQDADLGPCFKGLNVHDTGGVADNVQEYANELYTLLIEKYKKKPHWIDVSESDICGRPRMISKVRGRLQDVKDCPEDWTKVEEFFDDRCIIDASDASYKDAFRAVVLARMDKIGCPICDEEGVSAILQSKSKSWHSFGDICTMPEKEFCERGGAVCEGLKCERMLLSLKKKYCDANTWQLKPEFENAYIDQKGHVVFSAKGQANELISFSPGTPYADLCSGGSSVDILDIIDSVFLNVTSTKLCSLKECEGNNCKGKKTSGDFCKRVHHIIEAIYPMMPETCSVESVCQDTLRSVLQDRCNNKAEWVDTFEDVDDPAGFELGYLEGVWDARTLSCEPGLPARLCVDRWGDALSTSHSSCIAYLIKKQEGDCNSEAFKLMKELRGEYFPMMEFKEYCEDPSLVLPAKRRLLKPQNGNIQKDTGEKLCHLMKSEPSAACEGVKWFGTESNDCGEIEECASNVRKEFERHCVEQVRRTESPWLPFYQSDTGQLCEMDLLKDVYQNRKDVFCASKNPLEITSMMSNVTYSQMIKSGCSINGIEKKWKTSWADQCGNKNILECSHFANNHDPLWSHCQYDALFNATRTCSERERGCEELKRKGLIENYYDYGCPAYLARQAVCNVCDGGGVMLTASDGGGVILTVEASEQKSGAKFTVDEHGGASFTVQAEKLEPVMLEEDPQRKNQGHLQRTGLVDNSEGTYHHHHKSGGAFAEDAEILFGGLTLPE